MIRQTAIFLALMLLIGVGIGQQAPTTSASPRPKLEWASTVPLKVPLDTQGKPMEGKVVLAVSISDSGEVTHVSAVSGDQRLAQAAMDAVKQWKATPYMVDGKAVPVRVNLPMDIGAAPATTSPTNIPVLPQSATHATYTVVPDYPPLANQANVRGTVQVRLHVGSDGKVKDATAISGPAMLQDVAVAAAKQWTFKPYQVDGKPTDFETTVTVNFKVGGS